MENNQISERMSCTICLCVDNTIAEERKFDVSIFFPPNAMGLFCNCRSSVVLEDLVLG